MRNMQQLEPKIDPARIYTPDEAGEIFRVPAGTVRRLFRQGSLSGFMVGSNIRMVGSSLLEFMRSGGAKVDYAYTDEPDGDDQPAPTFPAQNSVAA